MYCQNCGTQMDDRSVACPKCGLMLVRCGYADPRAGNKIAAGVCGILLGSLGIHKFILGYTGAGLTLLLITVLTCGLGGMVTHLIGLIEGIIYLTKSDEDFVNTYVINRRPW